MFDKDTKETTSETSSLDEFDLSSSQDVSQSPVPRLIPDVSNILTIYASGVCGSLTGSSQLHTPVYRGTDTTAQPLYVSERFKQSSGKAILRHKDNGPLLATLYTAKFHSPKIRRLDSTYDGRFLEYDTDCGSEIIKTKNKWYSKSITLNKLDDGRQFEWAYTRTETTDGKKKRVLVLSLQDPSAKDEMPIAVLLRSKGTRTPGSSRWGSGNGGHLILHSEATRYLGEDLIVASCIMMLKREMDRDQAATVAAIS